MLSLVFTHIINLTFVVWQASNHFASQLGLVGLMVQPNKCTI